MQGFLFKAGTLNHLFHFQSPFNDVEIDFIFKYLAKNIFENKDVIKVGHNIKFDLHWVMRFITYNLKGRFDDTMLMHHLLDELSAHGLKDLTSEYFPQFSGYEKELSKYSWDKVPLDILAKYAATDSDLTLRFYIWFEDLLLNDDENNKLYVLYRNLTIPSMLVFLKAEHHGAKINREYIIESIKFAEKVLKKIRFMN